MTAGISVILRKTGAHRAPLQFVPCEQGNCSIVGDLLRCFFRSFCVLHASSTEGILQPIIRLMTGVFPEWSRDLLYRNFSRPGLGPHPRIFHRELVKNRVLIHTCDPFNHVQILRSREWSPICEIGGVNHQSVALPAADRVAHPLADILWQMRTPVEANDAGIVDFLGFDEYISGTLCDPEIAVVARRQQRRSYVVPNYTTRAQRPVLRTVEFMSFFAGRPGSDPLLGIRRQGRDPSFRPYNQRGSPVPGDPGLEPVQAELRVIVMHILCRRAGYA